MLEEYLDVKLRVGEDPILGHQDIFVPHVYFTLLENECLSLHNVL